MAVLVAGGVSIGLIVVAVWYLRPALYRVPDGVGARADFALYFPRYGVEGYKLKPDTVKLAKIEGANVMSFVLTDGRGNEVTISEQAYPEVLIYEKFANSLNPDKEAGTNYGKLTMGHPKDARGQQVVGMRINDTLLLGKPAKDLDESRWRMIINSLELVK